jgi:N-glycosylase/DNA lyase
MRSGQTFGPQWDLDERNSWRLVTLGEQPVLCGFTNVGDTRRPLLRVTALSQTPLDRGDLVDLQKRICGMLHLHDDLPAFYRKFECDPLSPAFQEYEGLRLVSSDDPFEGLISSLCSQNTSANAWNNMVQLLSVKFGQRVSTEYGVCFTFPTPTALSTASIEDLRRCRTGYRAEYIKSVSRMVAEGVLTLHDLRGLPYSEAKSVLIELPGVGEKVADCFLLYGLGFREAAPVDIWIDRIVKRLYPMETEGLNRVKVGAFLRERFGNWAGYAQLYLFHYARTRLSIY